HLRLLRGHHAGRLQLQHRRRAFQGRCGHRADLRHQLAVQAIQPERTVLAMKIHNTTGGRIFDAANYVFLAAIGILTLLPFVYVFAGSFATEAEITRRPFFVWPEQFSLGAYEYIFSAPAFTRALITTVLVTVV